MIIDVAYLITESSYFLSHRRPLAEGCRAAGWRTTLITNLAERHRPLLADISVIPFNMRRASHHPLRELMTMLRLFLLLRRERPRLVHAVGLKPVLYGAFAAKILKIKVVCALAGLGYLFMSSRPLIRVLRRIIIFWMRFVFRNENLRLILQNDDDAEKMVGKGIVSAHQLVMIRGSGVDLNHFLPKPEPEGVPVFTVVARMLADKGIRELVLAARLLRWRGVPCRIQLVGDPDLHNSSSISQEQLAAWASEGVVAWQGHNDDIAEVWARSHVCVLPSYREGLPKALLEAAACGRPIITTDVPGCRAVVTNGVEGYIVPAKNWTALADAMESLARSKELRAQMGKAARLRAEAEFGQDAVVDQTMALYSHMLGKP